MVNTEFHEFLLSVKFTTLINPEDNLVVFFMSWSGGCFDIVRYPNRWIVVDSKMVRSEVIFWQETLLNNLK